MGVGRLLVLVACGASCADGPDAPAETPSSIGETTASLEGSWSRVISGKCSGALEIDTRAGTYAVRRICLIDEVGIGEEVEMGQVDLSAPARAVFLPRQGSCPTSRHPNLLTSYSVKEGHLWLQLSDALLVFQHGNPGPPYEEVDHHGCWIGETFADHPVQDL